MALKKIPMRMCVITREKYEKKDLIRIVRTPQNNIIIDETGKANGKGAYLKKDKEVIEKAERTKALNRVLETDIPNIIYEELKNKY